MIDRRHNQSQAGTKMVHPEALIYQEDTDIISLKQEAVLLKREALEASARPNAVFILGVSPRSGTNMLSKLISLHPDCKASWLNEDYLIAHSYLLKQYSEAVYSTYDPQWGWPKEFVDLLALSIGNGLLSVLHSVDGHSKSDLLDNAEDNQKIIVTKTPIPENAENCFRFFPESRLLFLVRDGREVISSGMKAYGWSHERATRIWKNGAESIRLFDQKHAHLRGEKYLIIRYEALQATRSEELRRIFDFLRIPADRYPFDASDSLPIIGSSYYGQTSEKLSFTPVIDEGDFESIARWSNWSTADHQRFSWLTKDLMEYFGYQLAEPDTHDGLRNRFKDLSWMAHSRFHNIRRRLFRKIGNLS